MIRTLLLWTCLSYFLCIVSCAPSSQDSQTEALANTEETPTTPVDSSFAGLIEQKHKKHDWYSHASLSCDFTLYFNDKLRTKGKLTMRTHAGMSKLELENGVSLYFDGQDAFVYPDSAEYPGARARFDVLTWPYFLAAPYKLKDPGAKLEPLANLNLNEQSYEAAKMIFTQAVGDTPEDWYILFRDPATQQLEALAYIVTFGKTLEEANADPHLIRYENYQEVEGIPLASRWTFWEWKEESGLGKQIGEAQLENFQFIDAEEEADYKAPEGSRRAELPRPEES